MTNCRTGRSRTGQCVQVEAPPLFAASRPARPDESQSLADLWLRSRYASIPAIPAPVHSDNDAREWFASVVVSDRELWVITTEERPAALLVLDHGWIDQLYVEPSVTGRGLGSRLVELAKSRRPAGLQLWTFATNVGAQRFYVRHGFTAVEATDGSGTEEKAPDVRFLWTPAEPASLDGPG